MTDHLDLWTSALLIKSTAGRGSSNRLEAYGIEKLRALILEMALRGKLVPHNRNDEPAGVLLKKIRVEKGRLIDSGKIKSEKRQLLLADDEKWCELPKGWEWVRFSEYAIDIATGPFGSMIHQSDYVVNGVPLINPSHMLNDKIVPDMEISIPKEMAKQFESYSLADGDIVMARRGEVGRIALVTEKEAGWLCGTGSFVLRFSKDVFRNYLKLVFRSDFVRDYLSGEAVGTTMVNLNHGILKKMPLAIPPLAEQRRIVAKVDELMALCDQLEQQQGRGIEAHQTMVETLLGTLTNVASVQEFAVSWSRIAEHFDTLFTTEHSIDQLKEAILQLAVMGKLVPQDPNDEGVQVLLNKNDQRRRKIAEDDRRADVELQPILSVDDCWGIPKTWTWRGLADLVLFVDYRGKTPVKLSKGIRLLTAKNVRVGQIDLSPEEFLSEADYAKWMTRGFPKAGDVLFTTEAPMGNAAVVGLSERFALAQRVICFQGYGALASEFLVLQILSNQFQYILDKNGTGMTAKGIKASKLKQLPIAIPPLAEQHRIVAKVDELMALCDALKARLAEAQTTQIRLADAIVERAVAEPELSSA